MLKNFFHIDYQELVLKHQMTLGDGYQHFMLRNKINSENKSPLIVRLFENPASPFALSGAISLLEHDLLHCILCKGITSLDEAFVIGYTMGSCRGINNTEVTLFKFITKHVYTGEYKFNENDIAEFDRAFLLSQTNHQVPQLNKVGFANKLNMPIKNILREYAISPADF
jgi:hypothetical protein